jgi:hypothetical protein
MSSRKSLDGDTFSSEDLGVYGPRTGAEHRDADRQYREQQVMFVTVRVGKRHRQLGDSLNGAHDRGPQANADANAGAD